MMTISGALGDTEWSGIVVVHEFVTGGGLKGEEAPESWRIEGEAMRRALAREFAAVGPMVRVVTTRDATKRGPRFSGETEGWWDQLLPTATRQRMLECPVGGDGPDERAVLEDWAARPETLGVVIVAPETDGILAERVEWVNRVAPWRWLGASVSAMRQCGDKLAMAARWRSQGVATPPGWVIEAGRSLREWLETTRARGSLALRFPIVVKPLDGAGCWLTRRFDTPEAIPEGWAPERCSLVQPWWEGIPASALVLGTRTRGATVLTWGRQRIDLDDQGRLGYRGGVLPWRCRPEGSTEAAIQAATTVVDGLYGLFGVDFLYAELTEGATITMTTKARDDQRGWQWIEINPRPTTSCVALIDLLSRFPGPAARAGDLGRAWLAAVLHDNPAPARRLRDALAGVPPTQAIHFNAAGQEEESEGPANRPTRSWRPRS
jgi:predicted ATP-grasp superfamily ATP-dependent carboligase